MKADKKVWDWRAYILNYAPDNATYKHLLLTLSCYMDSAGSSCFPSIDTLEKVTSLSRPTIIKYLKQAKKDGWIEIEQHGYAGQQWKRNEYTASIPEKVVKEVNYVEGKGSKTDKERQLNSQEKVVKEVNSISSYTSSNNSSSESAHEGVVEKIKEADLDKIQEIWYDYLKEKGKHPTLYEREVLASKLRDWGLNRSKKILLVALQNGYLSLKEDYINSQKQQNSSPFRPDAIHL